MTHKEFVIWLKGFAKAANPYNVTPAQWDAIVEELDNVIDEEYTPSFPFGVPNVNALSPINLSGSIESQGISFTVTSGSTSDNYTTTVWNDKMGNWHYTNYTEGFGYYQRPDNKKEKQLLND